MKRYLIRFLYTLDLAANVVVGGSIHQTLSARAHRAADRHHPVWGWTERFINRIFFWQPDHCRRVWLAEQEHRVPTMTGHDYLGTLIGALVFGLVIYGLVLVLR